jgi:predicted Rossmann fold flavoprotein
MAPALKSYDVIIIGAGAAGLMCAIEAARRGRRVLLIDHAAKPAEKIRISGGGKCNFTHLKATPKNYLSQNPHFCISALKRFTPWDFLDRVLAHGIGYFEKTEGQLFCDTSAQAIIDMLLDDLAAAGGELWLSTEVSRVEKIDDGFSLTTNHGTLTAEKLVVATGSLSIPKMGATGFAHDIARQFDHEIVPLRAGLVPFTLGGEKLAMISGLAGVSLTARISLHKVSFTDGFLFTHRGLSGPAVLQISSYWMPGQAIEIDLLPGNDLTAFLAGKRKSQPRQSLGNALAECLPRRLTDRWLEANNLQSAMHIADLPKGLIETLHKAIHNWTFIPDGTEGYRTAEVTVGGIDTRGLSSQTMESQLAPGLYFIGEAVDVTGWLGGYNFQWAWSSGWAAGQAL